MLMFKRLRALRTNENILIASDVLLSSKSSFMNVFLMAHMINVSLESSPINFVIYSIVRYAAMGVLAVLLLNFYRRHKLAAWRASMVFSLLEIAAIMLLDPTAFYYPYVLAILSSMEASMYWRPKVFFDVSEVEETHLIRFRGTTTILTEIVKIVMPSVLGFVIGINGYTNAAYVVLAISAMQLLLSLCFHPSSKTITSSHSWSKIFAIIQKHESLQKLLCFAFVRGLVICSSAYLVISQIELYRSVNSELDLGLFTSLSAIIAIVLVMIYRRLKNQRQQKTMLLTFMPAVILLPLALIIYPSNATLAIVLYVFMQGVVGGLFDGTVTMARLHGVLGTHLHDSSYRLEVECLVEVALSIGRTIGFAALLFFIVMGWEQYIMWIALVVSLLVIPWYKIALPKKHRYN